MLPSLFGIESRGAIVYAASCLQRHRDPIYFAHAVQSRCNIFCWQPAIDVEKYFHYSMMIEGMSIKALLHERITEVSDGISVSFESSDLTQALLERGLIRWYNSTATVTEKGRQFIFQCNCEKALEAISRGSLPRVGVEVTDWLLKHQFAINLSCGDAAWKITPRGRDWLAQLE